MTAFDTIPVVLFAYARPDHVCRTLQCLRENRVPLILAFADGAKGEPDARSVNDVRRLLRSIDWCEIRVTERNVNWGLGRNVLGGITDVATHYDAFVVWEDDLVCVPGTYAWLCSALRHYATDSRVMSVTAWSHPRIRPTGIESRPYFDGRAESWSWGSWSRSWRGMITETARQKLAATVAHGIPADAYGDDLPAMARDERRKNIWAVRWLYHHLMHSGLCLRPPWSMVEHCGFDSEATNAVDADGWENPPLMAAPPVPEHWPSPEEHPACRGLWYAAGAPKSFAHRAQRQIARVCRRLWTQTY